MPSTITTPVSTRLRPVDIDAAREAAQKRDETLSSFLAAIVRRELSRPKAA